MKRTSKTIYTSSQLLRQLLLVFMFFPMVLLSQNEHLEIPKDRNWLIWNGEKHSIQSEILKLLNQHRWNGFILKLKYNQEKHVLYNHSEEGNDIPLAELMDSLVHYTIEHRTKYVLFFDVEAAGVPALKQLITKTRQSINYKENASTSSLKSILKTNSINWFSLSQQEELSEFSYYAFDYFKTYDVRNNTTNSNACKFGHQSSLLYHLMSPIYLANSSEHELKGINLKHYWQKEFLRLWDIHGIQPSFLVMDGNPNNIDFFISLARTADVNTSCHGSVTQNGVPLRDIYWKHNNYQATPGLFNFPLSMSKELRPYKNGFEFIPTSIHLEQSDAYEYFQFEAKPLKLGRNLELNLKSNSQSLKTYTNIYTKIAHDNIRGDYFEIERDGEIKLDKFEDYNIPDNSFTIAFWLKIADGDIHHIVGSSDRIVRQGLHIQARHQKPYFGYYINDLASEQRLNINEWHHLAFVYDRNTKIRNIYINGVLTEYESDCPSFIGTGTLTIGSTLKDKTPSSFSIDDFCVWSRALSANEVLKVQMPETILEPIKDVRNSKTYLWFIPINILFLIGLALFLKKDKPKYKVKAKPIKKDNYKNAILLFGPLAIINKNGKDISPSMPPLLKELFVILLLENLKGNDGLSSEQLTHIFWEDLAADKARNNRNVALSKLRKLIAEVDGVEISYHNKKHQIQLEESVFCDYHLSKKLKLETIASDFNKIKRGVLLQGFSLPTLDSFTENTNSEITDQLLQLLHSESGEIHQDQRKEMCQYLLLLDDLNEDALRYLLIILNEQDNTNLAIRTFAKFTQTYETVYGKAFGLSMGEFLR